jgi:hypothetical protein
MFIINISGSLISLSRSKILAGIVCMVSFIVKTQMANSNIVEKYFNFKKICFHFLGSFGARMVIPRRERGNTGDMKLGKNFFGPKLEPPGYRPSALPLCYRELQLTGISCRSR